AASAAVIVSAASVVACGDSSDEATKTNAAVSAQTATKQQAVTKPATQASPPKPTKLEKAQTAKGTVSLSALRFGYGGKLVVTPNGDTPGAATIHWYKPGTHVTVRAVNTKLAEFREWSGVCRGKKRVCKVVVSRKGSEAYAGFDTADGVKKTDPGVKFILND